MKKILGKLSYANVVATIALFIALGGASYAAVKLPKNSVGAKQIKANAITASKIKDGAVTGDAIAAGAITGSEGKASTLGTVPKATEASTAASAQTAVKAQDASHADRATLADHASVSDSIAPPEVARWVGSPGQPPFGFSWHNEIGEMPTSFYRDQEGLVHLQGLAVGDGSTGIVFVLPAGFRPSTNIFFPAAGNSGDPTSVYINAKGVVESRDKALINLNGITFRAEQ